MIRIESGEGTMFCHHNGSTDRYALPAYYCDIAKFDIERLENMCEANGLSLYRNGGWDILAVGYWLEDGTYEEPAPAYAENGIMMHIWTGRAQDYDEAMELGGEG